MKKITLIFLSGLSGLLFLNSCDLDRHSLDESNLEKVANYYYCPGKKTWLSPDSSYHFLSVKSKEQISLDDWKKLIGDNKTSDAVSVTVLGEKESSGNTYAIVSVINEMIGKDEKLYKAIFTRTWVIENNKWKVLRFPKIEERCKKSFQDGDYSSAKSVAENWLSMDPFSVEAYDHLGGALKRINSHEKHINDILRAMLSINPEDTIVLFEAVSWSESSSVAKTYLKKLEGTHSYDSAAFNYAMSLKDFNKMINFLDGLKITPDLVKLKLLAITGIMEKGHAKYTKDDFFKVASNEGSFEKIKTDLDENDSAYSADWAGLLGLCFFRLHDKSTAQKYLDYGISRDPNNEKIKFLAEKLEKK